eukprot:SAG31_NODE_36424_length_313_cov_1.140187_1_plen_31_part_10
MQTDILVNETPKVGERDREGDREGEGEGEGG